MGAILRKPDFCILVRLLQSEGEHGATREQPSSCLQMNEKDAGEEIDLGFAIQTCQGRDPINAVLELIRASSPMETPPASRPAASVTAKPVGGARLWGASAPTRTNPGGKKPGAWARPSGPTILEGGGDDFLRRRPRAGPVTRLHHQAVLGELVEVVQGVDLTVPGGVDADDVELEVAPRAVLAVTDLVASDDPILQMFLGSLCRKEKKTLKKTSQEGEQRPPVC